MNVNRVGSWIYYNQPVSIRQLVQYTQTADTKGRAILAYLTYRIPLYEHDNGRLGINLELMPFKNFRLLERTEV